MTHAKPDLDRLRIGRPTVGWTLALIAAASTAMWGVYAFSFWVREGMILSGLRTIGEGGASWGLGKSFAIYFIGLSFGGACTAAIVRLFQLESVYHLRRMAEVMTLTCLPLGGAAIIADLGRPLEGLYYLPAFAQPMSPLFGTFTMVVAVYLFANAVYLYLDGRADAVACARRFPRLSLPYRIWASGWRGTPLEKLRHERASYYLSAGLLPLEITAMSTLGFVFGIQGGRPGWFSAVQAPSFIAIAAASGIGMLTLIVLIARRTARLEDVIPRESLETLAKLLWGATIFYLYIMIVETLTATYAAGRTDTQVAQAILWGPYAGVFWGSLACFVVPVVLLIPVFLLRRASFAWLGIAAFAINIGAMLRRLLIVVPSQTHGMMLPHPIGVYFPSWIELSIIAGLMGVGVCIYLIAWKLFPLLPVAEMHCGPGERAVAESTTRARLRVLATVLSILVGFCLAITGLLLSARFGTEAYLDPLLPFSPMIFALGMMFLLFSVAAFETFPPTPAADTPEQAGR
jgi:molybdopterin-containing oxidoreductase family membrane subunit